MKSRLTKYLTDFSSLQLTRPISDKVRLIEILAVVLTGIGKFVFMDYLNWRLPFVIVAILGWSFYVYYRYTKDKNVLKDWGFRRDNFKSVLKLILPFAVISIVSFFVIGFIQGTINLTWHIIPLLITYPIWGSIQQFLTIGLLAGNLKDFKAIKLKKGFIILVTAIFFSVVHYPSVWLMIGTFILALFYGYVYLKAKNIYVLGLFHGWLGALFYYTVVNQDPFCRCIYEIYKLRHMKSKLLNELPELLEHQIISEEVASNIEQYYKTKVDHQPNRLFTVFGVLGSALVGLGIILIIAHNWDNFSKSVKTFFAFLPMVLAQIISGYSILKKKSQTWKESSGTLLFFTIGACIAMVSQIYNIPGNLSSYLLTWTILSLPLIYVLNSKAVAMLTIIFASYYASVSGYDFNSINTSPWLFLVLLLATVPFYIKLLKKEASENTTAVFNWLYALSLIITLGAFIHQNWALGFVMYAMLFGVFYNLGKINPFHNQQLRRNSYAIFGSLGMVVVLIILSFNFLWKEILRESISIESQEALISIVLFITAFALMLYSKKQMKDTKFNLFQYAFLLFAFTFILGCATEGLGAIFSNIVALSLGLFAIKIGADTFRFSILNYGLLIITTVIVCRFFDTNMSFVLRGILFVLVGIGFFLTNYVMLQKQKNRDKNTLK